MNFIPFESSVGKHVFIVDGSRIYDVDERSYDELCSFDKDRNLSSFGIISTDPYINEVPPDLPSLHALSLNVAQSCNLACGYCYADEGRFNMRARMMKSEVAIQSAKLLLEQSQDYGKAVLGFMGGEPLLNKRTIRDVTHWSATEAERRGIDLSFSLTTNATMINDTDVDFLGKHKFTVAVSLDGPPSLNDLQRPTKNGLGSTEAAMRGLSLLLSNDDIHVSIRATVTPKTGPLKPVLDSLISLGAREVGFAPVLVSPNSEFEFRDEDFLEFLKMMIECGEESKQRILERVRYPFSNFETGIFEISRGSHKPYSCSAAAGYGSVSASGQIFGCHRSIDDPAFSIGDLTSGLDAIKRTEYLKQTHVLNQSPCNSCWARFLCGGGCQHEVRARGRPGCDFIRGWLRFLLSSYAEISQDAPDYLIDPNTYFSTNTLEKKNV